MTLARLARGVWLAAGLEALANDWRFAWRGLRRAPGFTALVVITVALTIAANTAVSSVVQQSPGWATRPTEGARRNGFETDDG